jgi:hypothetical protein
MYNKNNLKLPVRGVTIREINHISDPRIKTRSVNATSSERAGKKRAGFE